MNRRDLFKAGAVAVVVAKKAPAEVDVPVVSVAQTVPEQYASVMYYYPPGYRITVR